MKKEFIAVIREEVQKATSHIKEENRKMLNQYRQTISARNYQVGNIYEQLQNKMRYIQNHEK